MHTPRYKHHKARAVTLVELLIVTAIIVVLCGILLPALSQARRASQKSVCAFNLRQLALAMNGYDSDIGGGYPLDSQAVEDNGQLFALSWYGRIPSGDPSSGSRQGLLANWITSPKVYSCPGILAYGPGAFEANPIAPSYAANILLASQAAQKTSNLTMPAETILLVDALTLMPGAVAQYDASLAPPVGEYFSSASFHFVGIHNQLGNVAFCDGHVEASRPVLPQQQAIPAEIVTPAQHADLRNACMGMCMPSSGSIASILDPALLQSSLQQADAGRWFWINKDSRQ